jgi:hypothetical protein
MLPLLKQPLQPPINIRLDLRHLAQATQAAECLALPLLAMSNTLDARRRFVAQHIKHDFAHASSVSGIGFHVGHDHRHADVLLVPAVVVGAHADHGVAELGLAREFGLGQAGHVDYAGVPGAVQIGLGTRGKLRAFHADKEAFFVDFWFGGT